jgi:hypothetical protein
MNDKTKIADATYGGDLSGLKLDKDKTYSVNERPLQGNHIQGFFFGSVLFQFIYTEHFIASKIKP